MPDPITKLRDLLRELFQLDNADLDFGIYRIMNLRRAEITRFLDHDLLPQVKSAFAAYQSSDAVELTRELAKITQQLKDADVDPDAAPKVKQLRDQLAGSVDLAALEQQVFSDLYSFFRRYYSDGDFLSLRRYKEGVYAIPYEGEEVKLHWANHDQYYIKSSEYLRDYAFVLPGNKRVHFRLTSADVEKDNNKAAAGSERRFILAKSSLPGASLPGASPVEEIAGELILRFEYRPDDQKRKQSALIESAESRILELAPPAWSAPLSSARAESAADPKPSVLRHHLNQYTARNTFDYFIHKNLGGFLRRELDFFIKNEILHLDDIESLGVPKVEQTLSRIKVLRQIAHKIITFLAQIEDFQKKLWLKKKFVIGSHWLITVDRIAGGGEKRDPLAEQGHPSAEKGVSLAEKGDPSARKGHPLAEDGDPSAEKGGPLAEKGNPSAEKRGPLAEKGHPSAGKGDPAAEKGDPLAEKRGPLSSPGDSLGAKRTLSRQRDLRQVVADNSRQWQQWESLGFKPAEEPGLGQPQWGTRAYLDANDKLVVDTSLFARDPAFLDQLLACEQILAGKPTLDDATTGTLIHSENFQALILMHERWQESIKCVYTDPPYNTGGDGFMYKDAYLHSSWMSMLRDRLAVAESELSADGVAFISIDDIEQPLLAVLGDSIFTSGNKIAKMVWKGATDNNPTRIAVEHEYIECYAKSLEACPPVWHASKIPAKELMLAEWGRLRQQVPDVGSLQDAFRSFIKANRSNLQPLTHYDRVDEDGPFTGGRKVHNPGKEGYRYDVIHPVTKKPCQPPARGYRFKPSTMDDLLKREKILFGEDHTQIIQIKEYLKDYAGSMKGLINLDSRTGANALEQRFGSREIFKNPKPVELVQGLLVFVTSNDDVVLDFFGGSGTTGHAVLNLNLEDGGSRRFILVEMGEYFETVLKPRIAKVMYSPDWKDGRAAVHGKGISGLVKVLKLEGYEDTLNNLHLTRSPQQATLLEQRPGLREQYTLGYLLDAETRGSPSLLNLDRFDDPFDYKLNIATGTAGETRPTNVDLVETFNWLLGLRVKGIDVINGIHLVEGTNPAGEKVLVLWRKVADWPNEHLNDWLAKRRINPKDMEFDLIYVNGDNNLENLKRDDEQWKVRLIEEEFQRLMFDVQDM